LYGGVAIGFGALIVVEVDLCQSAEEVGFVKIRFGIDDLIELLYGEHIVLEVQGVACNHHHALRINLGM
jgi:hypothetical protein